MKTLRTPDQRFSNLPGFPFDPNYVHIDDGEGGSLRVHYVDEGPESAEPVLLMHGEPTWSYLYRKMIPIITRQGYRAIAPDLVGFGRSDKPADRADYTYRRYVDWMQQVIDRLSLSRITLVCQDWGGLIGLRLVAANPERFARVVTANTGLPTGDQEMTAAFHEWQKFSREAPEFPVGNIIAGGCHKQPAPEVIEAYDAPFPDDTYKEGARIFPSLVPTTPDDPETPANREAWKVLENFEKPFLTAFSDQDPITRGGEKAFQKRVAGAKNRTHITIEGGGHFLQEDCGEKLAEVVCDFIRNNPN
ncbi:MAG: haloalkane dehalogenase [Desulfobacteraceae bacterium]|nr:haloalkane dehalogenase [Desulfobacteraceae bacterium]